MHPGTTPKVSPSASGNAMKCTTTLALWLVLTIPCLGGCGDQTAGPGQPADFSGEWVLVSTLAQKMPCPVAELDEISIEEVRIEQAGNSARLDFADYSVLGEVIDGVLYASGSSSGGRSLNLELRPAAQTLHGTALLLADGCHENRSVVARPRTADADFSGHWEFQLRVVGDEGCEIIVDYVDCFRIFQSGSELLVVDDVGGNLSGQVFGDVAHI
jgi:hypothetical protein